MWGHIPGLLLSKSPYYFLHQVSTTLNKFNRIPSFVCIQKGVCHAPSSASRINIYPAPSPQQMSQHRVRTSGKHCWLKHHSSWELLAGGSRYSGFWYLLGEPRRNGGARVQGCPEGGRDNTVEFHSWAPCCTAGTVFGQLALDSDADGTAKAQTPVTARLPDSSSVRLRC